jgi:hypothetical protein
MTIKLFTMVKNEVDIVTDWVFYHGYIFGYENIHVIDNYSTDGTYEKLKKFKPLGINLSRKANYEKKGEYMTSCYKDFCDTDDFCYPLDIDEFIVHYNKDTNKISASKKVLLQYFETLPNANVYKTNYIQATPNQDNPNGYKRAAAECKWGFYDGNYKESAKSFIKKPLFRGEIDHGNHIPTNVYYLTDLCLIHFHNRNVEQIKKKIYFNVTGFGYNADSLTELNTLLKNNPNCAGNHHVEKQILILKKEYTLPWHPFTSESIDLTPLNDYVKKLNL